DVVVVDAGGWVGERAGRQLTQDPARFAGFGPHCAGRRADDPGRRPGGVVEAGLVPAGDLVAGVERLAEVVVVVAAGSGCADLPGVVRGDHLLRAVGVADAQVEPQPRGGPPFRLVPAPVPRGGGVVE